MQIYTHLCGQELERSADVHGTYFQLIRIDDHDSHAMAVQSCPRCNELLYDTDMLDCTGVPLLHNLPPESSIARHAALAGLGAGGYQLHWDDGWWRVRPVDSDRDIVSCDTLDGLVELAQAISANQIPIRLYYSSGRLEQVWEGRYSVATGTAIGRVGDGPTQRIGVMLDGERMQIRADPNTAPLIGHVRQRTDALIEGEFCTEGYYADTRCGR
jgi:hypothetical protein